VGRKRSLFSGGKLSIANKISVTNIVSNAEAKVDISEQALEERAVVRQVIPDLDLKFSVNVLNGKKKRRDCK